MFSEKIVKEYRQEHAMPLLIARIQPPSTFALSHLIQTLAQAFTISPWSCHTKAFPDQYRV
jgi:hypothetical protein